MVRCTAFWSTGRHPPNLRHHQSIASCRIGLRGKRVCAWTWQDVKISTSPASPAFSTPQQKQKHTSKHWDFQKSLNSIRPSLLSPISPTDCWSEFAKNTQFFGSQFKILAPDHRRRYWLSLCIHILTQLTCCRHHCSELSWPNWPQLNQTQIESIYQLTDFVFSLKFRHFECLLFFHKFSIVDPTSPKGMTNNDDKWYMMINDDTFWSKTRFIMIKKKQTKKKNASKQFSCFFWGGDPQQPSTTALPRLTAGDQVLQGSSPKLAHSTDGPGVALHKDTKIFEIFSRFFWPPYFFKAQNSAASIFDETI